MSKINLTVREDTDALVRVLVTLRRRGCRVIAVDYHQGDRHRAGWMTITYDPPARHAHAVAGWLRNLVDVLEVEDAGYLKGTASGNSAGALRIPRSRSSGMPGPGHGRGVSAPHSPLVK